MRDRIVEWFLSHGMKIYVPGYLDLYLFTLICGLLISLFIAKNTGYPIVKYLYKTAFVIITGYVFARLYGMFVIVIQTKDFPTIHDVVANSKSGSIGAYIGLVFGAFLMNKFQANESLKLLDIYAPVLAFNLFLGRIGCFMSGCCYGKISSLPWAVSYPQSSVVHIIHQRQNLISVMDQYSLSVHPTQLYESGFGLALFIFLLTRNKLLAEGVLTLYFFISYSSFRTIIEFLRGDEMISIGVLNLRQIFFLSFLMISLIILIINRFKTKT